jgi:CRP-like cAMP-binding protein
MMKILANKNMLLNRKIDHLSKKTIRAKLMAFLIDQAETHKSLTFNIPFSRNELADYLCIDRSALSRELGKMRDEGLLDMHRNSFKILNRESFLM